jgi:iron complex transport system ATP-binding protein
LNAMILIDKLSVAFGEKSIINDVCLTVGEGKILSIIGPNGSGKSTLLKAISRNVKPREGSVFLDGSDIRRFDAKALARHLAVLHQGSHAPADLTVRDLVEYGRFPYQHWWKGKSEADHKLVDWSLEQTGLANLAARRVSTLSGGEQQRAWIAMALAQKPRVLLLDEPTTYLDICYQFEVLELVSRLNREQGITVIMVLHDINYAAKYSDHIAVLCNGQVFAVGRPDEVITADILRKVFRVEGRVLLDSINKCPVYIAQGLAE